MFNFASKVFNAIGDLVSDVDATKPAQPSQSLPSTTQPPQRRFSGDGRFFQQKPRFPTPSHDDLPRLGPASGHVRPSSAPVYRYPSTSTSTGASASTTHTSTSYRPEGYEESKFKAPDIDYNEDGYNVGRNYNGSERQSSYITELQKEYGMYREHDVDDANDYEEEDRYSLSYENEANRRRRSLSSERESTQMKSTEEYSENVIYSDADRNHYREGHQSQETQSYDAHVFSTDSYASDMQTKNDIQFASTSGVSWMASEEMDDYQKSRRRRKSNSDIDRQFRDHEDKISPSPPSQDEDARNSSRSESESSDEISFGEALATGLIPPNITPEIAARMNIELINHPKAVIESFYGHSPGEVYTIPEEEDEICSPTGADGVTSLRKQRMASARVESSSSDSKELQNQRVRIPSTNQQSDLRLKQKYSGGGGGGGCGGQSLDSKSDLERQLISDDMKENRPMGSEFALPDTQKLFNPLQKYQTEEHRQASTKQPFRYVQPGQPDNAQYTYGPLDKPTQSSPQSQTQPQKMYKAEGRPQPYQPDNRPQTYQPGNHPQLYQPDGRPIVYQYDRPQNYANENRPGYTGDRAQPPFPERTPPFQGDRPAQNYPADNRPQYPPQAGQTDRAQNYQTDNASTTYQADNRPQQPYQPDNPVQGYQPTAQNRAQPYQPDRAPNYHAGPQTYPPQAPNYQKDNRAQGYQATDNRSQNYPPSDRPPQGYSAEQQAQGYQQGYQPQSQPQPQSYPPDNRPPQGFQPQGGHSTDGRPSGYQHVAQGHPSDARQPPAYQQVQTHPPDGRQPGYQQVGQGHQQVGQSHPPDGRQSGYQQSVQGHPPEGRQLGYQQGVQALPPDGRPPAPNYQQSPQGHPPDGRQTAYQQTPQQSAPSVYQQSPQGQAYNQDGRSQVYATDTRQYPDRGQNYPPDNRASQVYQPDQRSQPYQTDPRSQPYLPDSRQKPQETRRLPQPQLQQFDEQRASNQFPPSAPYRDADHRYPQFQRHPNDQQEERRLSQDYQDQDRYRRQQSDTRDDPQDSEGRQSCDQGNRRRLPLRKYNSEERYGSYQQDYERRGSQSHESPGRMQHEEEYDAQGRPIRRFPERLKQRSSSLEHDRDEHYATSRSSSFERSQKEYYADETGEYEQYTNREQRRASLEHKKVLPRISQDHAAPRQSVPAKSLQSRMQPRPTSGNDKSRLHKQGSWQENVSPDQSKSRLQQSDSRKEENFCPQHKKYTGCASTVAKPTRRVLPKEPSGPAQRKTIKRSQSQEKGTTSHKSEDSSHQRAGILSNAARKTERSGPLKITFSDPISNLLNPKKNTAAASATRSRTETTSKNVSNKSDKPVIASNILPPKNYIYPLPVVKTPNQAEPSGHSPIPPASSPLYRNQSQLDQSFRDSRLSISPNARSLPIAIAARTCSLDRYSSSETNLNTSPYYHDQFSRPGSAPGLMYEPVHQSSANQPNPLSLYELHALKKEEKFWSDIYSALPADMKHLITNRGIGPMSRKLSSSNASFSSVVSSPATVIGGSHPAERASLENRIMQRSMMAKGGQPKGPNQNRDNFHSSLGERIGNRLRMLHEMKEQASAGGGSGSGGGGGGGFGNRRKMPDSLSRRSASDGEYSFSSSTNFPLCWNLTRRPHSDSAIDLIDRLEVQNSPTRVSGSAYNSSEYLTKVVDKSQSYLTSPCTNVPPSPAPAQPVRLRDTALRGDRVESLQVTNYLPLADNRSGFFSCLQNIESLTRQYEEEDRMRSDLDYDDEIYSEPGIPDTEYGRYHRGLGHPARRRDQF